MNKGSDTFYNHEEIHEENTYLEKKKSFFMGKCFLDYGIKNYTKNTQSFIKHMFAKIFDIDPKNKFKSDLNEISNKFEKNKEKMPAIFKNIQECVGYFLLVQSNKTTEKDLLGNNIEHIARYFAKVYLADYPENDIKTLVEEIIEKNTTHFNILQKDHNKFLGPYNDEIHIEQNEMIAKQQDTTLKGFKKKDIKNIYENDLYNILQENILTIDSGALLEKVRIPNPYPLHLLQRYDVFSTDDFAFNIYQGYDLLADDDLKDTLKGGGKTTSFDIMTIINRIGTIRKKIQEFDILYKENKCLQREHSKIGLNPVFNKATGKYIYRMQEGTKGKKEKISLSHALLQQVFEAKNTAEKLSELHTQGKTIQNNSTDIYDTFKDFLSFLYQYGVPSSSFGNLANKEEDIPDDKKNRIYNILENYKKYLPENTAKICNFLQEKIEKSDTAISRGETIDDNNNDILDMLLWVGKDIFTWIRTYDSGIMEIGLYSYEYQGAEKEKKFKIENIEKGKIAAAKAISFLQIGQNTNEENNNENASIWWYDGEHPQRRDIKKRLNVLIQKHNLWKKLLGEHSEDKIFQELYIEHCVYALIDNIYNGGGLQKTENKIQLSKRLANFIQHAAHNFSFNIPKEKGDEKTMNEFYLQYPNPDILPYSIKKEQYDMILQVYFQENKKIIDNTNLCFGKKYNFSSDTYVDRFSSYTNFKTSIEKIQDNGEVEKSIKELVQHREYFYIMDTLYIYKKLMEDIIDKEVVLTNIVRDSEFDFYSILKDMFRNMKGLDFEKVDGSYTGMITGTRKIWNDTIKNRLVIRKKKIEQTIAGKQNSQEKKIINAKNKIALYDIVISILSLETYEEIQDNYKEYTSDEKNIETMDKISSNMDFREEYISSIKEDKQGEEKCIISKDKYFGLSEKYIEQLVINKHFEDMFQTNTWYLGDTVVPEEKIKEIYFSLLDYLFETQRISGYLMTLQEYNLYKDETFIVLFDEWLRKIEYKIRKTFVWDNILSKWTEADKKNHITNFPFLNTLKENYYYTLIYALGYLPGKNGSLGDMGDYLKSKKENYMNILAQKIIQTDIFPYMYQIDKQNRNKLIPKDLRNLQYFYTDGFKEEDYIDLQSAHFTLSFDTKYNTPENRALLENIAYDKESITIGGISFLKMFGQKMRGQKRSTSHDSRIKQKNIVNSKINNPNSTNIIYYRELLYVQQNALKKEQKSIERQIEGYRLAREHDIDTALDVLPGGKDTEIAKRLLWIILGWGYNGGIDQELHRFDQNQKGYAWYMGNNGNPVCYSSDECHTEVLPMKEDMYFPVFLVKDQTSTKKKEKAISNETNKKRILNDTKNTHISKKTLQRKG